MGLIGFLGFSGDYNLKVLWNGIVLMVFMVIGALVGLINGCE